MTKKRNESPKRTFKKLLFAQHYILGGMNIAQALQAAGYSPKNSLAAYKFLRDPQVIAYMQALLKEQQEKLGELYRADKENIINELTKIAFADPRRVVRVKGGKLQVIDSDEITNIEAAAIAELAETKKGLRIKFHSKVEALDKLAKILGLYVEKHEHAGKDGGPLRIILSQLNPEVFGGGNSPDA